MNGLTIARHPLHGLPTQVSNSKLNQTMEYNGYGESKGRTTTVNNKRSYDYGLTYNLIGQITGKTETLADGTNNTFVYGYDDKRRLISVLKNNIQIESYDYDANGNRELKSNTVVGITDQVATFNIADQQQSDGTTQFEYDTNGRLSKKLNPIVNGTAIEEYSYSSQGRLLSVIFKQADQTTNVTITIKTINYKHNALGNRVAKLIDGSVVEKYLWLDKTTLLATYDQNDNLKQRFEYGLSHTPVKFTQNSNTYYITSDHLGSPRTITDESGNVIKALDYDSFGNVVSDSNESFEIPFGFAGGLKDSDTSLLRFGYRDYDPSIGRWTARDPIGFAGGDTNLYGYVASDPVNFLDPTGLVVSVGSRDVVGSGGLGAHTYTNVTSNGQSVTYSSHNVDGVNQVIRNHPSDHGTNKLPETSSVIIAPPTGMSQEQWDRRVIESAERLISGDQDGYILFPPKGGTSGKKNRRGNGGGKKSNCHVTTNGIIQGAGGNIPMSYNPPGFNPGL